MTRYSSKRRLRAKKKKKKVRIEKEAVQIPEDVRIPEDVHVEILKRLPVKSLLRFRCACKTWYSLISDPVFCNKLHQKRACVLITGSPSTSSTISVESLLTDGKNQVRSTLLSLPWITRTVSRKCIRFLGSCNGLVCVYQPRPRDDRGDLILWNPSTRKYMKLPSTSRVRRGDGYNEGRCSGGFGYDKSKDDYKFVWMACHYWRRIIEFDVFSLKSKTWSSFGHSQPPDAILSNQSDPILKRRCNGVFFNGAIHWSVCHEDRASKNGIRILALDLASSDKYKLLEAPKESDSRSKVVSLSGCLCLYTNGGSWTDLWMMKEYGVDSSWIKLVSLPTTSYYMNHPIHFSSEEGSMVATFQCFDSLKECREIMRLQVKEGAIVSYETLLSVSKKDVTIVLEESLVSVN